MALVFNSNGQAVTVQSFKANGSTTKTLTMGASVWTVAGSFNISGTNLTVNYNTSSVVITAASTITTKSGNEFYKLTISTTGTMTLATDIVVNNTLLGTTNSNIVGSFKIFAKGDVNSGNGLIFALATTATVLEFSGSSNQDWGVSAQSTYYSLSIIINKSGGTLTAKGTVALAYGGALTLTYTAGTFDAGSSTFLIGSANGTVTFNCSGIAFNHITFNYNISLSADITVNGTLTNTANNNNFAGTGFNINAKGDVFSSGYLLGLNNPSCKLIFNGTGTQTVGVAATLTYLNLDVQINKASGTLNMLGTIIFAYNHESTFTYTAGTVDTTTGTSTFRTGEAGSNATVNSGTLTFHNFTVQDGTTSLTGNLDVNATLLITGTLSAGSNTINAAGNFTRNGTFTAGTSTVIFDGTSTVAGATTFNNLTIASGATVHLTSTQTFTVSGAFTTSGTSTLDAVTGGSRANLPVNGSQSVVGVTATDIDSSGGSIKPILNTGGTQSNCVSWGVVISGAGGTFLIYFDDD